MERNIFRTLAILLAVTAFIFGVVTSCKPPDAGDTTSPTVSILSSTVNPTADSPIDVSIVFSEVVTGFDVFDLTLANATASNFAPTANPTFTVDLTPDAAELTVTLNIAAGVCTDAAGNPNVALQTAFSRLYTQRPSAGITSATTSFTNASPIPITITFNKAVENFDSTDITLTNCGIGNFAMTIANTEWTAGLTPVGEGLVQAAVAEGVCNQVGASTVTNIASATFSRTFDSVGPGVGLSSSEPDPTSTSIQITITFNEQIDSGTFTASDISVSGGGSASNLQTSNDTVFTADVTPGGEGSVTISLAAGICQDLAGNLNAAAPSPLIRMYETVAPSVALSSSEPEPTNTSIQITITFSETIASGTFTAGDITVSGGGSSGNLQTSNDTVFTADVTPGVQGTVTISLAAGVCTDLAGNYNTAAPSSITRTYDSNPAVSISSTTQIRTNTNPIPITITFDEPVTGFVWSDLTVGNGTAGTVSGGPSVYTCDITPTAAGAVTIDIPAGMCLDLDGTPDSNTAAAQFTRTYITNLDYHTLGFAFSGVNPTTLSSFTIPANSNRLLIASVHANSTGATAPIIASVTFGATPMTLVPGSTMTYDIAGPPEKHMIAALYYLKDPAIGAGQTVTATLDFTPPDHQMVLGVISFYDSYVHGGNDPFGNLATGNAFNTKTITSNISTTTNYSWLVDVLACETTFWPTGFVAGAGQTLQWSTGGDEGSTACSTKPMATAGATSMSWTVGSTQDQAAILHSIVEIKIAQ